MGLFNKTGKKTDQNLERLITCPSCRHTGGYGVTGCGCKRRDCACTIKGEKK